MIHNLHSPTLNYVTLHHSLCSDFGLIFVLKLHLGALLLVFISLINVSSVITLSKNSFGSELQFADSLYHSLCSDFASSLF